MGWIDDRPHDVNEQITDFAHSGRLVELDPRLRVHASDKASTVLVMCLTSATIGIGASLLVFAIRSSSTPAMGVGLALITIGLSLLLPAVRLVRLHTPQAGASIRPGAVLPPDLIRAGNWIHRKGGWARVEEIGRGGGGNITALLSTDEVVELTTPTTIAGGAYRPAADPVASLRR